MTGTSPVEVEATLAFVGENRISCLQAIATRVEYLHYWRTPFRRLFLHDRYYDLPGGELSAAGAALRWRRSESTTGIRSLLALKGPVRRREGASLTRLEVEKEWAPPVLEEILGELPALGVEFPTLSLPTPEGLTPEAPEAALTAAGLELIQDRRTRRLVAELREGPRTVAEFALDHVVFDARGRCVDHREVEIESKSPGGRECLERIATELIREFGESLRVWVWSKAALGGALERLADEGRLAPLLSGEEITTEGYDSIEELLAGSR